MAPSCFEMLIVPCADVEVVAAWRSLLVDVGPLD
jgi:hypothetical protein